MIVVSILLFLHCSLVTSTEVSITSTFVPSTCDVKAENGDVMRVHYTGSISETSATGVKGRVFDSSVDKRKPLKLILGKGEVIKGWEQGLLGMCVGEKRTLVIPPELGYGNSGSGRHIPGGATLKFEVECVDIIKNKESSTESKKQYPNVFKQIDIDGDWLITYEEMLMWFMAKGMKLEKYRWHMEDKNRDGIVTWEEFSGLKGDEPPPPKIKPRLPKDL
jgi:FKBP-type peptidyl-prolyl cis-trans isomerase 2